jgi:hypothetical protein
LFHISALQPSADKGLRPDDPIAFSQVTAWVLKNFCLISKNRDGMSDQERETCIDGPKGAAASEDHP